MKRYNLVNNVVGWIAFLISAVTYILTTEASASFWDCGEFISTADKLLVGHPPGAPFFMIVARLFAIFAPSAATVAKMVNVMSALCSAFTILFLFWSTTHLARKIFIDEHTDADGDVEPWRVWSVMGAGLVGALAYTFSDTFWFSAVEGEVYAMSSLFTAVVFWCILKWENVADQPGSNRWLILIAYLMGLSIGVHLLNLLCIPAIGLVYYFKKYEGRVSLKGVVVALAISCVALGAILYGIIPGLVAIAGSFEIFFVNSLGLPFNSGAIFWLFLLLGALVWGIYYTYVKVKPIINTILTSVLVIIVGYSSFAMIVIRSAADPTMDQNSPDNVFALIDYLNREQYGDRPLFYGQSFASPYIDKEDLAPIYVKRGDKYVQAGSWVGRPENKVKYIYDANMAFPRMYSNDQRHVAQYKSWTNFKGKKVMANVDGQSKYISVPTMGENLAFFFKYQVNFMYLRYFMWNFSGRQNDIQSHGELIHGNWITGIPFIDNFMLGDQELLSDDLKSNKGHNTYFMLPLLLGLAGLFYQYGKSRKGKEGFWIVMLLFFMTGLAIVVYLNQTPLQPRERDYAYAGSFYAFAIWIGLGVLSVVEALASIKLPKNVAAIGASIACLLAVPCVMAQQNWDDHDRSGCTITRDIAYNYLNSCAPNAVIFTNGDNDTFPLWYAQEVEGIRTDVRVCNLSYLQTDWYADQMKRKAYDSDPLPISFTHDQYSHDRDVIYLYQSNDSKEDWMDLNDVIKFVRSDDPRTKRIPGHPDHLNFIPGNNIVLPIDSAQIVKNDVISPSTISLLNQEQGLPKAMHFTLPGRYILKNSLFVLDMLATSNWERPLYYAVTVGSENYCGLSNYFRLEGLAYRISPIYAHNEDGSTGSVDVDKMYDNVMNKFRWGFYKDPDIYYDENKVRMGSNFRSNLTRLATELINWSYEFDDLGIRQEYKDKAKKVLDKLMEEIPSCNVPYNYFSLEIAEDYYNISDNGDEALSQGDAIIEEMAKNNLQELQFYLSLSPERLMTNTDNIRRNIAIYSYISDLLAKYERKTLAENLDKQYREVTMFAAQLFNISGK